MKEFMWGFAIAIGVLAVLAAAFVAIMILTFDLGPMTF